MDKDQRAQYAANHAQWEAAAMDVFANQFERTEEICDELFELYKGMKERGVPPFVAIGQLVGMVSARLVRDAW